MQGELRPKKLKKEPGKTRALGKVNRITHAHDVRVHPQSHVVPGCGLAVEASVRLWLRFAESAHE